MLLKLNIYKKISCHVKYWPLKLSADTKSVQEVDPLEGEVDREKGGVIAQGQETGNTVAAVGVEIEMTGSIEIERETKERANQDIQTDVNMMTFQWNLWLEE